MNRTLTAIALAGLLLLAGCSAAPIDTATATAGTQTGDDATIVTSGSGSATADPDTAVLRLAVVATGERAEAVRADAADRSTALFDALRAAGVPDDAITTVGYSLTAQYDYSSSERETIGYRAVHSIRVETTPDRAGAVLDTAVVTAGTEVYGVQFTLSDAAQEQLRAEALEAAMLAARADADAVADTAELAVGGVEQVTVGSNAGYDVRFTEADGGSATTFQPGSVSVTVSVSVTYRAS